MAPVASARCARRIWPSPAHGAEGGAPPPSAACGKEPRTACAEDDTVRGADGPGRIQGNGRGFQRSRDPKGRLVAKQRSRDQKSRLVAKRDGPRTVRSGLVLTVYFFQFHSHVENIAVPIVSIAQRNGFGREGGGETNEGKGESQKWSGSRLGLGSCCVVSGMQCWSLWGSVADAIPPTPRRHLSCSTPGQPATVRALCG